MLLTLSASATARRCRMGLLLLGLVLAGRLAHAQATQDALATRRPVASPAATGAAIDTAASLHRLFERERHANAVKAGISAGLGLVGYAVAASNNSYKDIGAFTIGTTLALVSLGSLVKGSIGLLGHLPPRERRIVRAWHEHRLPPRWLRRALRPATIQYVPAPAPR